MFKFLNFPRYHEYDDYLKVYNKIFEEDSKQSVELMRTHFMAGIKQLNNIKSTDEGLRNIDILSNKILEDLSKIVANNSFAYFKCKSTPEGKKVKVLVDLRSNEWLPKIDIDYI